MTRAKFLIVSILFGTALAISAPSAMACATCFGVSDSPMAKGMNWGIFSLLIVIVTMLASIAGFFIFLAKKSAATQLPVETKNV
jgi:hypothetical protein